ncbi:putative pyruvate dehydrogenase complex component Pdx1 [Aspergillus aculeatinus CBS 121060]|uniref:Pyruvate dehydrogenase complex component Pdx1 n=1 Tax=Aspergillus aculeatinus CBS 121060 TaxID=1448322 RepID=A0ACD1GYT0_9EURO|nr:putative pyruvate dehydrogenase complex component Pdx1 [Aspergillus aculeatinus CBS 121060]RAH66490.1 putative pyruvate dehydrogenase complex component Pdx1 [Aspergillus aculeatinus CBS 121060]
MASSFPLRRLPAALARRQPRVINTSKRLNSTAAVQYQNPAYPLYPSVSSLLHEKGIPESEISKIPATGPKGRLLKGDVLAYLGKIPAEYPATQAARFAKLGQLDLSNIKIVAAEAPKPAEAEPTPKPAEAPVFRPPPTTRVAVPISLAAVLHAQKRLQDKLHITVPLSTFLERATDLANEDLPRSVREKPTADELFDELVLGAAPARTSRGEYFPEFNAEEDAVVIPKTKSVTEDIIDILAGSGKAAAKKVVSSVSSVTGAAPAAGAANVFSLTVPVGDEKRAQVFLDRVKSLLTVEPGRLVL